MWAGTPEYTASCGDLLIGPRPGLSNCRIIVLLVLFTPESLHKASDPRIPGGGRFDKSSNALFYSLIWRYPGRKWAKRRRISEPRNSLLGGELRAVQAGNLSPHRKWVPSGLHPYSSSGEAVIPRQLLRNHSLASCRSSSDPSTNNREPPLQLLAFDPSRHAPMLLLPCPRRHSRDMWRGPSLTRAAGEGRPRPSAASSPSSPTSPASLAGAGSTRYPTPPRADASKAPLTSAVRWSAPRVHPLPGQEAIRLRL